MEHLQWLRAEPRLSEVTSDRRDLVSQNDDEAQARQAEEARQEAAADTSPPDVAAPEDADEASPSGGANIAGNDVSQLDLAPPMANESGTGIPAPNLRQPVVEGALPEGSPASREGLDPALMDPDETARDRVEGRTSDAASRNADARAADTPPDINTGVKQSDAGPDEYPFPPGGDVEVASVPDSDGEGEYMAPLEVEDWVILGEHELVPDRLVGRRAAVLDAPRYLIAKADADKTWITVRTRDEANATLTIPLSATTEVVRGGRDVTVRG
jgi:hypothetical protein